MPLESTLRAIAVLHRAGRFERFGLSNFSAEQVRAVHDHCSAHASEGYPLPTVYQASYSAAVRGSETTLFPTLRELGLSIQAYSPMAAGLLAKSAAYIEEGQGKWDPATPTGKVYRDLYYKPSYVAMLHALDGIVAESGVSRVGLAYRWVRYHSALKGELGDEVILGASDAAQLEEAVGELEKGPLLDGVARAVSDLWEGIKADAPVGNLPTIRRVFGDLEP